MKHLKKSRKIQPSPQIFYKELYTTGDISKMLLMSDGAVRRLMSCGYIDFFLTGSRKDRRVTYQSFINFLENSLNNGTDKEYCEKIILTLNSEKRKYEQSLVSGDSGLKYALESLNNLKYQINIIISMVENELNRVGN